MAWSVRWTVALAGRGLRPVRQYHEPRDRAAAAGDVLMTSRPLTASGTLTAREKAPAGL